MKLYTSYYANLKNIPADHLCVGISRICPEWLRENHPDNFLFVDHNILAPNKDLFEGYKNGSINQQQFVQQYKDQIHNLFDKFSDFRDLNDWIDQLSEAFEDKYSAIVFLCYERPSDFCHRHILREILNYEYNTRCDEYPYNEVKPQAKELKSKALF